MGTFSLLLVALAFAQLSIASLSYFKVTFLKIYKTYKNDDPTQQIDYGVVIEQMTRQTVLEKYQVPSLFTSY